MTISSSSPLTGRRNPFASSAETSSSDVKTSQLRGVNTGSGIDSASAPAPPSSGHMSLEYDVMSETFVSVKSPPNASRNPFAGLPSTLPSFNADAGDPECAAAPNPFKPLREQVRIVRIKKARDQDGNAGFGLQVRPLRGKRFGATVVCVERDSPAALTGGILAADVIEEVSREWRHACMLRGHSA